MRTKGEAKTEATEVAEGERWRFKDLVVVPMRDGVVVMPHRHGGGRINCGARL